MGGSIGADVEVNVNIVHMNTNNNWISISGNGSSNNSKNNNNNSVRIVIVINNGGRNRIIIIIIIIKMTYLSSEVAANCIGRLTAH